MKTTRASLLAYGLLGGGFIIDQMLTILGLGDFESIWCLITLSEF